MSMFYNTYWAKIDNEWRPIYICDISQSLGFWKRLYFMCRYESWIRAAVHYGDEYVQKLRENTPFQKYILEKQCEKT